jgi:hypothetical protein
MYIDPMDKNSMGWNPMVGDKMKVAAVVPMVLQSLFGDQDAFFKNVQLAMCQHTVLLLKATRGDNCSLVDLARLIRNFSELKKEVEILRDMNVDHSFDDLIDYFDATVFHDDKTSAHAAELAVGLRQQLDNILAHDDIRRLLCPEANVLNLDEFLRDGGVLAVNTALGKLVNLSKAIGLFFILELQYATFRRPTTDPNTIPFYLYIDELPQYVNEDLLKLLDLGRGYRCAATLALQNVAQLAVGGHRETRDVFVNNCRNKIVFGGMEADDAKFWSAAFGEQEVIEKKEGVSQTPIYGMPKPDYRVTTNYDKQMKPVFSPTDLMYHVPFKHLVYKVYVEGTPQTPRMGVGDWLPKAAFRDRRVKAAVTKVETSEGKPPAAAVTIAPDPEPAPAAGSVPTAEVTKAPSAPGDTAPAGKAPSGIKGVKTFSGQIEARAVVKTTRQPLKPQTGTAQPAPTQPAPAQPPAPAPQAGQPAPRLSGIEAALNPSLKQAAPAKDTPAGNT